MNQRLTAYRRLASARSLEEVDAFLDELRDRYGAAAGVGPQPGANTRGSALMADRIGLESLDREGSTVVLKFRQDARLDPAMHPEAHPEPAAT